MTAIGSREDTHGAPLALAVTDASRIAALPARPVGLQIDGRIRDQRISHTERFSLPSIKIYVCCPFLPPLCLQLVNFSPRVYLKFQSFKPIDFACRSPTADHLVDRASSEFTMPESAPPTSSPSTQSGGTSQVNTRPINTGKYRVISYPHLAPK
jgi:hypothetical protein